MASKLDRKPTKLQWAIPNESAVGDYIQDKIDPFIKGIETLNAKVEDYMQKEKARLKRTRIKVAGGDVIFTGTSASSKRSKTVKELYMDEADLFSDGDMIELEGRTKSYEMFGRKVLATSSKKYPKGEIHKAGESCETHKEWHTVCNKCGHHWLAGSKDLKWLSISEYKEKFDIDEENFFHAVYKAKALEDVYVECPMCKYKLTTAVKNRNIITKKYKFFYTRGDSSGKTIKYKGNALAMYFTSFETIASLIIDAEATGTFDDMSQIYLDYFNEIYETDTETVDKNDILLLGNHLEEKVVPDDTYMLFLGIDTQKDHFWYTISAFRYGSIMSVVDKGKVETFQELELLMGYRFKKENGDLAMVDYTTIDRMGILERTIEVDAWVTTMVVEEGLEGRLFPTIGVQQDASGRLVYETTLVKDMGTKQRLKTPLTALKINNTLVKNELQSWIDRSIKKAKGEEGYEAAEARLFEVNKTIVDDAEARDVSLSTDFERQITAEEYIYKVHKNTGKVDTKKSWVNTKQTDNHYWDCLVQNMAMAIKFNVSLAQKPEDSDFEEALSILNL